MIVREKFHEPHHCDPSHGHRYLFQCHRFLAIRGLHLRRWAQVEGDAPSEPSGPEHGAVGGPEKAPRESGAFKGMGWTIIDPATAYQDFVYSLDLKRKGALPASFE